MRKDNLRRLSIIVGITVLVASTILYVMSGVNSVHANQATHSASNTVRASVSQQSLTRVGATNAHSLAQQAQITAPTRSNEHILRGPEGNLIRTSGGASVAGTK